MSVLAEKEGVVYEKLSEASFPACIELMAKVFSVGEPMTALLGVTLEEFRYFATVFTKKALNEGLPIVARDSESGELVGFSISEDLGSPEPAEAAEIAAKFDPIVGVLDQLLARFRQDHEIVPGRYVHVFMVGVAPGFKKRSVAYEMMYENMILAKQMGFVGAIGETTSDISTRLTEKNGFKEQARIYYRDFEFDGVRVFKALGDEACCRLMVRYF